MNDQDSVGVVQDRWDELSKRMHERKNASSIWLTPLVDALLPHQAKSASSTWMAPLVDALRHHPRIGQLFPYTSLNTLCLSRSTRYPFSGDCPHVEAIGRRRFRVAGPNCIMVVKTREWSRWRQAQYDVLGEGGIAEAISWIEAALPPGCGPAIVGDLDDLRRFEGKSVMTQATSALYSAVMKGNELKVAVLLKNGTDVDASTYKGFTPLMSAVWFGMTAVVQLLLEHGADFHARTSYGETALSLAVSDDKHPEIVALLKSAGAVE